MILKLAVDLDGSPPSPSELRGSESYAELSPERLNHLQSMRLRLEERRAEMKQEMLRVCSECHKSFDELALFKESFSTLNDYQEYKDLDKAIVEAVESDRGLSLPIGKKNLESLRSRLSNLLKEKQNRRTELSRMGEEIARLWSVLHVPSQERDRFQSSFSLTLSEETLNRGRQELKRLKEIRSRNMEKVLSSLKEEVEALWVECGMSEEQRQKQFPLFFAPPEHLNDDAVRTITL